MKEQKIFVGIGGGAIQLGLWGYYANLAGLKVVIAEVDDAKVRAIRNNNNYYSLNIAYFDRIVPVTVGPVQIYNPTNPEERKKILDYIEDANDIVTAVPSASLYEKGGVAQLLKEGLARKKETSPVIVYASENQIEAAVLLKKLVFPSGKIPSWVKFSDTVIARMGGFHSAPEFIKRHKLALLTEAGKEAFLVEDFDKIIIEKCKFSKKYHYETGFKRFFATNHINIYEEQKLFGHNAVHALLGFVGKLKGYIYMSDYAGDPDFGYIGVDALREETGFWFKKKYSYTKEEDATPKGYEAFVVQLCQRIINPFLYDSIDRIIRDPDRKLSWNDRFIGVIRNSLAAGVVPKRYIIGVAAGLLLSSPDKSQALSVLENLWKDVDDEKMKQEILVLTGKAFDIIKEWQVKNNLYSYLKKINYL
ncbi:MAG: hypothetical protein KKH91_00360 [Elusimicrobia bacterium]|nr:hypothetical protein [Elusimicrobiota bacterium]MBU2614630.1 hypothetical protein [Elusimicrobiota bacterium]